MRLRLRQFLLPAASLAAAILPTKAWGATVKATLENPLNYQSTSLDLVSPEVYNNAYVGEFVWDRTDGGTANPPAKFNTFCIEITQNVYLGGGPYTFTTASLASAPIASPAQLGDNMGLDKANFISQLWGNDFSKVGTIVGSYTLEEVAAAFQVAVWEIVYDGTGNTSVSGHDTLNYDLALGNFSLQNDDGFSADVIALAKSWLDGLDIDLNDATHVNAVLAALTSSDYQDQVFLGTVGAPTVPLPGAAAAAVPILMLGGATLKSKRRRRQAEESAL